MLGWRNSSRAFMDAYTSASMTQNAQILAHLQERGSITDPVAREKYGVHRLAARVHDLKKQGHKIESYVIRFTTRLGRPGRCAGYKLLQD